MKTILKWFGKAFLAGCLALVSMTAFCLIYYNLPAYSPNESGATDYKWVPNTFYSRLTEGTAHGRTNNEGFLNAYDYEEGMKIDTLVMGSSHMEGYQVALSDSVSGRLDKLMEDKNVYNIGISGHSFLVCCSNFKAALERYRPSEYVIIETGKLNFTSDDLDSVLDGTFPEMSNHSGGILGLLSRNQYFRLVYAQLKGFMGQTAEDIGDVTAATGQESIESSYKLDQVLSRLGTIASEFETEIIIFYHPSTQINTDGSLLLPDDAEARAEFSNLCAKNGITFLDMTERFQYEYDTNHILPHGFINSTVGSGHLNKYGHEMIADELYKIISCSEDK